MSEQRDSERSAAFLQTMNGIMNGGALALMCSIGHKTELFDAMAAMEPASSEEIAFQAGLQERYVREWLAAVTAGGIVDYDPATATYHLPAEHAGLLTRAAGPLNLTTYCQYVPLLAQVEDDVIHAFRHGGGVPYDRYPEFQTLMAESSGQRLTQALIDQVVPLLPGGYDGLDAGLRLADVGCGRGRALNLLAAEFPRSRFVGFDIAEAAIEVARSEATAAGNDNLELVVRDAARLDEHERFDIVTSFDAVHDQAKPDDMITGVFAALRPGGTYLCVEPKASSNLEDNLEMPAAPLMYTISTMHCMTVSLAADGDGLGTAWGEHLAIEKLGNAGFVDIRVTGIKADRANHYLLATKPNN